MYRNRLFIGLIRPLRLLAALSLTVCSGHVVAQGGDDLTGEDLYRAACSGCHSLGVNAATRNGRPGWEATVHKMVLFGAQLNVEEMDKVTDYLTSRFGPGNAPMRTGLLPPGSPLQTDGTVSSDDVVLPEGEGKALVQSHCTACHDLGRVVSNRLDGESWRRYTEDMLARGDTRLPADQMQALAAYLTRHFGLAR